MDCGFRILSEIEWKEAVALVAFWHEINGRHEDEEGLRKQTSQACTDRRRRGVGRISQGVVVEFMSIIV